MPFVVVHRRTSPARLRIRWTTAVPIDVTSRGPEPWVRFSPFFPHGGIPVPFSPGQVSMSVEGIWQALKVFERADVDPSKLSIITMRGIKRSARRYGRVLGHRAGLTGNRLLSYAEARRLIYLPSYRWVLENRLQEEVEELRRLSLGQLVALLDYTTNCDVDQLSRPLSHACLVGLFIEGRWPT
jgi:hypothetical protein